MTCYHGFTSRERLILWKVVKESDHDLAERLDLYDKMDSESSVEVYGVPFNVETIRDFILDEMDSRVSGDSENIHNSPTIAQSIEESR